MRDIATATLSGTVELRELPSAAEVARLRVATTARRRHGEEWIGKTNYFTVEVYGAQARACAEHLSKGSRVGCRRRARLARVDRSAEQQA
jgi:single-stranded DNA-binding protein